MSDHDAVLMPHDTPAPSPRRDFLRHSLLLALPLAGVALPVAVVQASQLTGGNMQPELLSTDGFTPPKRARGSKKVNVRNFGARGNGTADDTTAFQNAVNALPSDGGTVYVPAGTYRIDAVRSVRLRSRMHLQMDPSAKLVAKRTGSAEYNVLLADTRHDVEISGGQIIGDREQHTSTTGEGGHGIRIRGSQRVTIRDIRISKCWGDGITVGPKPVWKAPYIVSRDVVLVGVVCTENRRNALSIGNVIGMKVYDSEFSNTHGTKPQCGIDVEPDEDQYGSNDSCDNILIQNCVMNGNAMNGITLWSPRAQGVTVKNCVMNGNGVCGVFTQAARNVVLTGNTISHNRSTGMALRKDNANYQVYGNTSFQNYAKQGPNPRTPFYLVGVSRKVEKDLNVSKDGSTGMSIGKNYYR
jgi:hypothetical protein